MVSLAFVLSFVVSAVAMLIGIVMFSEMSDGMAQTFGEPLLVNETNSTEFTNVTPIVHAFDEVTVAETHTGDSLWTTIPNISLSSGEFTAGNKYLLIVRADVRGDEDSSNLNGFDGANFGIRTLHGSTDFVGSELGFSHRTVGQAYSYSYFTVWTAVASENITMEFIIHNKDSREVKANNISITAIALEDFVENEDYFYDERIATETLECLIFHVSNCPIAGDWTQTNPSITWTPNGSDDWLVMGNSQLDPDGNGDLLFTRLNFDDSILTPFLSVATEEKGGEDLTRHVPFLTRVYTPSASSHTVEIESSQNFFSNNSNGLGKRLYGSIFAINLDKFEYHADNYITSVAVPANQGFNTNTNTMTVDFDTTEDTFIIGFLINDSTGGTNSDPRNRMQINNQDIWIEGTSPTINHKGLSSSGSRTLTTQFTMENFNGIVDVDVDSLNSFVRTVRDNQLVAFSMSAKTFEFASQVPPEFAQSSNIALTVIGVFPIVLFFALFSILSGRGVE